MSSKYRSRRSFLRDSAAGLNAAWITANYRGILSAQEHARQSAPALTYFTEPQAIEIGAMAAQIIPTDETPGAREARCVYFIDKALTTFSRKSQPVFTQGLQDLQAKTRELYPGAATFSALTPDQQIRTLTAIEKTPFFEAVRVHTIIGFLSRPIHGGNHDKAGWKLIGYDDSLNHKPPFGYYDAQFEKAKEARR